MMLELGKHPCFDESARHKYARVHLPVAPRCNVQCNFCNRQMDCLNESRPGVTSAVLTPGQSITYLERVMDEVESISVVGIAGPGDPFAQPDVTMDTLRKVKQRWPDILLCVASNGLGLPPYVEELAALGVSHVTVTVNAVDPEIGSKIYAWVRPDKRPLRGIEGAQALLDRQLNAIAGLAKAGVTVKVNTIVMPGINEHHVAEVARVVAAKGAEIQNLMALYPLPGTPFGELEAPGAELMTSLRGSVSDILPQMSHCARCRADAVGKLGQDLKPDDVVRLRLSAVGGAKSDTSKTRPYVAVASWEGVLINQHLGEAETIWVFTTDENGLKLVETRAAPPSGGGDERWKTLAERLHDCRCILTSGAGSRPRALLTASGLEVLIADALIEEAVPTVLAGKPLRAPFRETRCGDGCAGGGSGCG